MTGPLLPIEVKLAVACEDIREEKLGKHTLVGVYSGDAIQISQIPGNIAIACFIEVKVLESGPFEMGMKLSGPGDHEATLKAQLDLPQTGGTAIIATPRIDLLVDSEGVFRIDIGSDEIGWLNIVTRNITLNSDLSIAPALPSEQSPSAPLG